MLNEVRGYLQRLDLTSIDSDDPIVSGILDVSEGKLCIINKLQFEQPPEIQVKEFLEDTSMRTTLSYSTKNN